MAPSTRDQLFIMSELDVGDVTCIETERGSRFPICCQSQPPRWPERSPRFRRMRNRGTCKHRNQTLYYYIQEIKLKNTPAKLKLLLTIPCTKQKWPIVNPIISETKHSAQCALYSVFKISRKIADVVFLEKGCRAEQVLERLLSLNFINHEEVVKVPQNVSFVACRLLSLVYPKMCQFKIKVLGIPGFDPVQ